MSDHDIRLRIEELADRAPVMISYANLRGEIEYANSAWLAFNGWSEVPRDPREWVDRIHPDDLASIPAFQGHASHPPGSFRFTARARNAHGEYRWIRTEAQPWLDQEGQIVGFVACTVDLTDEKRIRESLQSAEERMRLVMAATRDSVWDWNLATGHVYHSPRWWEMLGLQPGELPSTAETWQHRVHPDDLPEAARLLREVHTSGLNRLELEMRFRHRDGHPVPVLSRGLVMRDAAGRPTRILGANTDLTERRRADAERDAALDLLQKVAARLPGVVYQYRVRPDGTSSFPYASDKLQEIYRIAPADVVHDADMLRTIMHPDDLDGISASINASRTGLTPWLHEFHVRFPDGTVRWLQGNALPEREPDGAVLWHGFITDCTDRKASEQERETLAAQLRESQKMQAIGTLAGGIAHDFNNIAGAILGNVALASLDARSSPELAHSLDQIREAALRARDLTRQILAFSRRQPTNRVVLAVRPRIEAVIGLLRKTLLVPVVIESHFMPDAPDVLADPVQFDQVILNLLTNAAQAMKDRSGLIDIRVDAVDIAGANAGEATGPRRHTRIRITDAGHGMDAATLQRVFEPFFTTKPVDQGTGLGLSVVYGIMETHGGQVSVTSEAGIGSTFTLLFPASSAVAAAEAPVAVQAGAAAMHRGRILYIDDDRALLSMVQRLLGRRGYDVVTAGSGEQGLALLHDGPASFDMVLIDYNMPGMKGIDVARAVRRIRPSLPIALASGFITDAVHEEARQLGIADVIFKADAAAQFAEVVDRLLGAARAARSNPAPDLD